LNTKSIIHYTGNDVDVDSSDLNQETKNIEAENKKAIHDALHEVESDIDVKAEITNSTDKNVT
jgi:hypothetical protein